MTHAQQSTRTFTDSAKCDEAIGKAWENNGFVRRDSDTQITFSAESPEQFTAISNAVNLVNNPQSELQSPDIAPAAEVVE